MEIARHELITQWRSQTLKILLPLLLVLTTLIAFSHWQQQQDFIEAQTLWQQQNDANWEAQPDRTRIVRRITAPWCFASFHHSVLLIAE